MPFPKIEKVNLFPIWCFLGVMCGVILYIMLVLFFYGTTDEIDNSKQWGGYCPYEIYVVYDKDTGVYYAVTEEGGITPMYTIEGEVKLVDQGNEYITHKNLGDPNAQE